MDIFSLFIKFLYLFFISAGGTAVTFPVGGLSIFPVTPWNIYIILRAPANTGMDVRVH